MDQFQQLLQPHPASGGAAKGTALAQPDFFTSRHRARGRPPPAIVPIGVSYTPVSSGIGMPAGVPPLPSLFSPTNTAPAFEPAWKPQPPPWASSAPQLGVMPQRKF